MRDTLLQTIDKMGDAIVATTRSDKYVIMVACQDGDEVIHTYDIGESVTPDEFCRMAVELIMGSYGTRQGWEPPNKARPS